MRPPLTGDWPTALAELCLQRMERPEPTAADVVDRALEYRPFAL
ncbi:hypothetical protein ACIQOV_36575 [Kitasatospora sp. NPDC091257]